MRFFNDIKDCIRYAKIGMDKYKNIQLLVDSKDWLSWENKLNGQPDYEKYLFEQSKLNLLNLSILTGFQTENRLEDSMFTNYQNRLLRLNECLQEFPKLLTDRQFRDKVKNLEQFSFLSTLSELSLASYIHKTGLSILFETPFRLAHSNKTRDVDFTVKDGKGNYFHIEVYMPNKQSLTDGFFDPSEDDYHFENKVGKKLMDKFGLEGIVGLNGMVLLAVNIAFMDMLLVKRAAGLPENYEPLLRLLQSDVDGILLFEDDFSAGASFRFIQILNKW